MSFFGVELNAQLNRLLLEIRLKLSQNKWMPNFRTLYRSLVKYDPQPTGFIVAAHMEKAFNENGLFFKKYEFQVFEKAYSNEKGLVDWSTFMQHLREPMGPLRRQLVENIFDNIDAQKKGKIPTSQLFERFNPQLIEGYRLKKKSLEAIESQLFGMMTVSDGCVSREQFIAFYDDLSINFPHNDVFIRYVSEQWTYLPEKVEAVQEQQIKAALKQLRFKLVQKSQGTKDDFLIRKIFQQFDRNQNYAMGSYELDLMLKHLGCGVAPRLVEPMLIKLDQNKTGYVEFDEFKHFMFVDPYPI